MLVSCLVTALSLSLAASKLVVSSIDDLYLEDGTMDTDLILGQAVLHNSTRYWSEECPDIEEELQYFEYWVVSEAGAEERRFLEARMPLYVTNQTRTMTNIEEPWVQGHVVLR